MDTSTIIDLSNEDVMRMKESGIVAIDTESCGLVPNRDPLYLIQICDKNGNVNIIRNRNWNSAKNLIQIFEENNIKKVFHFAIMDGAFILKNFGMIPRNIYCTKIASKIARTYGSSHSLSVLCEELLDINLDKKQQVTFWGKESLSDEQLQYAQNDVKHLLMIKFELDNILLQKGYLPTGVSYVDLNNQCQLFIPTLIHLWVNGWDFGKEEQNLVFGR